jgi:diadenosine tetraphosphate (Ap4A) HIT family hydrolase
VLIAAIEPKLQALFGYTKINYLMLMMVDEHVHFHVFPRYPAPTRFAGVEWTDATWPKPLDLAGAESEPDVLAKIRAALI